MRDFNMKSAGVEGEMEIELCQLWAGRLGWHVFLRGSLISVF